MQRAVLLILIGLFAGLAIPGLALAQALPATVHGQIEAILAEKAARHGADRKLDSQLLYLSREQAGSRAVATAPSVRSRVKRESDGRVHVDISAQPSADLRQAITEAGGTVIYESPRWRSVSASLPPTALVSLAGRADVKSIKPGTKPISHTGPVTNQADAAHKAARSRAFFGVDGTGATACVISSSDDHSEASILAGELPNFTTLAGRSGRPGSGEGTAMAEILADIAPGAQIFFAAAGNSRQFMADSILALRDQGCQVIVDDISFLTEWQFQDDELGQAVNEVVADGVVYLSSAGNEGNLKRGTSSTWEGDFRNGGVNDLLPGGTVHRYGTSAFNQLTAGSDAIVVLQWSDEAHTSANEYDLYVLNAAGTDIVASSTNIQDGDDEPLELVFGVNPGEQIVIWKAAAAQRRYLRLIAPCCGARLEKATAGQTIGHANTPKAITVGASDASLAAPGPFTRKSRVEDFTSDGPRKMFYRPDGTPITPHNFLASGGANFKSPTVTAGDGGATSVPNFAPFYGTSASAPAAAAIAALVRSYQPSLTGAQVRFILERATIDIESGGFDNISGNGILMADRALALAWLLAHPHDKARQLED